MMNLKFLALALPLFIGVASCKEKVNSPVKVEWQKVQDTWAGAAEINKYDLKQQRYGRVIEGEAMLIFVREPFLKDRQVKDESGSGKFQVLKLNSTRDFLTGAYPYRTLVSVFQPLEEDSVGKALKVTTSVQEWCGHTYVQTNRKNGNILTKINSYFENEEGGEFKTESTTFLEDEIWTSLRINPNSLPIGKVEMIPGSIFSRFSHTDPTPAPAETRWIKGKSDNTVIYEITYPITGRKLAIEIDKVLPYTIQSWYESISEKLLSSGKLSHRETNVDYWNYSDPNKGAKLRKKLGLSK